jgi:UDP-N-acetylmuramate dehydrogenase
VQNSRPAAIGERFFDLNDPMRRIERNVSLKDLHTFRMDVRARYWAEFTSVDELAFFFEDRQWRQVPKRILSGGSNVLFIEDFPGLVLRPAIYGIDILEEDERTVRVRVGAGENWDRFVAEAVGRGWHGVENLSWIPGCVGTCPVQNIGAYGVEAKAVIDRVAFFSREDGKCHELDGSSCGFAYRDSIFKQELKETAVITHVVFRLRKGAGFTLTYGELAERFPRKERASLEAVRNAVIDIRRRKLPDPADLPNAGSFFKNPQVSKADFHRLKKSHPAMPAFPLEDGSRKIPAAWLVEQCGWKGFREKDAGVFESHALILVNHGNADGRQILALAERIRTSVAARFEIDLEPEVTVC